MAIRSAGKPLAGGVLGPVGLPTWGVRSILTRGFCGVAPTRLVGVRPEDLGLDPLERLFQDDAQVADHVLAYGAGLHGQLPEVRGELTGHPLQVPERPEVER